MSLAFFILFIGTITTLWQVNKLLVNLDTFTVGSDKMKICLRFMTATISHLLFTLIYINLYIYTSTGSQLAEKMLKIIVQVP